MAYHIHPIYFPTETTRVKTVTSSVNENSKSDIQRPFNYQIMVQERILKTESKSNFWLPILQGALDGKSSSTSMFSMGVVTNDR
jgi:hypothetical protein